MKQIIFIGSSLNTLKAFSEDVRREFGYQLDKVQRGNEADDWKPMATVGDGTKEIRVKDKSGIYRTVYVAKFAKAVYVLHAFKKKTQKTSQPDLNSAKRAYKQAQEDSNNE